MRAMRMWISAVWQFGSLAAMRSPNALRQRHLRLDPTSGVIPGPALPECPTEVPGRAQGLVPRPGSGTVLLPGAAVPADRDDGGCLPLNDRRVAAAAVIGAVGGHGADLLFRWYLVQQLWQDR